MRLEGRVDDLRMHNENHKAWDVSLHAYSDLSHVSPVVFLFLLKECYALGTCKATAKFRALQHRVYQVLHNSPQPGPSTFVAHCLCVLPSFDSYCEGFSHLIISALLRFLKMGTTQENLTEAKYTAAQLFLDIVGGNTIHDERILVKIIHAFGVGMIDIEDAMNKLQVKSSLDTAKAFVEKYIFKLIESQSYMTAVALLEHFSIRQSEEFFLHKMLDSKQYRAAEKWAAFIGKPMLCVLVQEYTDKNLLKPAYEIMKRNNLVEEFPEVHRKYKESSLKKLAEKGCWDIAEKRTNGDRQHLEYLVYLALEAGYFEKVEELCDRYSLEGFAIVKAPEANCQHRRYLQLDEFVEEIIWVDEVNGLCNATIQIEECKVVGMDCEWKPNYEKGGKNNRVSIMQIASEKMVFIFDLIKLFEDAPKVLDDCLTRVLHSPRILKLGYNFQCDVKQLACTYQELGCFKHYEMLLDVQNVFKETQGGLSGLAEKILGARLNKTRRNSNWEQRPLSQNQLEYAALDAAVLIHIFRHVRSSTPPASVTDGHKKIEWKSYFISQMDKPKRTTKERKSQKEKGTDELAINFGLGST